MSAPILLEEGIRTAMVTAGKQITAFEEPDIIYLKLVGIVGDDEVKVVNDTHTEYSRGRDHVFFLVDMSELETIPNSARKAAILTLSQLPLKGLSIYKAPLTARVLAKLIITGMKLFGKNIPLQFSETEAGARDWIVEQRAELAE